MSRVTKAVIPAAGRGTRLRPLTLFTPKELLPVGGKPMIQHALEMHMAAGISEFCVITSPEKPQLRNFLAGDWKPPAFPFEKDTRFFRRLKQSKLVFQTQEEPLGVGDAIGRARDFVGDEPFVCIMPDCLFFSPVPLTRQVLEVFEKRGSHVIATIAIRGANVHGFGNVGLLKTEKLDERTFRILSLSDKTQEPIQARPGERIHKGFGGGVYLPEFFDLIEAMRPEANGEIDDVPIHHILVREGRLLGVLARGAAFDAGHPLGLRTAAHYAGRLLNCPPLLP
jgi:UTP--glucose-1-phosphate uridylyltransferase